MIPARWNLPSKLLSSVIPRSHSKIWMRTPGWLTVYIENVYPFCVGKAVLRSMNSIMTSAVFKPIDKGVTSKSSNSCTCKDPRQEIAACTTAPEQNSSDDGRTTRSCWPALSAGGLQWSTSLKPRRRDCRCRSSYCYRARDCCCCCGCCWCCCCWLQVHSSSFCLPFPPCLSLFLRTFPSRALPARLVWLLAPFILLFLCAPAFSPCFNRHLIAHSIISPPGRSCNLVIQYCILCSASMRSFLTHPPRSSDTFPPPYALGHSPELLDPCASLAPVS